MSKLFSPINTIWLCTLSQFTMSIVPGGRHVSAMLRQQPQPQTQRRSNQGRIKLLIIHSWVCQLHQRSSLQSPSPLVQIIGFRGKRSLFGTRKKVCEWERERERQNEREGQNAWLCVGVYVFGFLSLGCVYLYLQYFANLSAGVELTHLPPTTELRNCHHDNWK